MPIIRLRRKCVQFRIELQQFERHQFSERRARYGWNDVHVPVYIYESLCRQCCGIRPNVFQPRWPLNYSNITIASEAKITRV